MSDTIYREFVICDAGAMKSLSVFLGQHARAWADCGKPLLVAVCDFESKRTDMQNRRYWKGTVEPIAHQAWVDGRQFDRLSWHEYLARKFGVPKEIELPSRELLLTRKSTTEMGAGEFSTYIHECEVYGASELGVVFPAFAWQR